MKPVKPLDANMIYRGPTRDIGDLECTRVRPGHIRTEWRLSADELVYVMAGANVVLEIVGEPIPPLSLNVTEPYCPECMVTMALDWREGERRDDVDVPAHWNFRCGNCGRWA